MTSLDDILNLLMEQRGITRRKARELLATMPGGGELISGRVSVEDSPLAMELLQDDPG